MNRNGAIDRNECFHQFLSTNITIREKVIFLFTNGDIFFFQYSFSFVPCVLTLSCSGNFRFFLSQMYLHILFQELFCLCNALNLMPLSEISTTICKFFSLFVSMYNTASRRLQLGKLFEFDIYIYKCGQHSNIAFYLTNDGVLFQAILTQSISVEAVGLLVSQCRSLLLLCLFDSGGCAVQLHI